MREVLGEPRISMARTDFVRAQLRPSKGKALGLMIAVSAAFWAVLGLIADAMF